MDNVTAIVVDMNEEIEYLNDQPENHMNFN